MRSFNVYYKSGYLKWGLVTNDSIMMIPGHCPSFFNTFGRLELDDKILRAVYYSKPIKFTINDKV